MNLDSVFLTLAEIRLHQYKVVLIHKHVADLHLLINFHVAKYKFDIMRGIICAALHPISHLPLITFHGVFLQPLVGLTVVLRQVEYHIAYSEESTYAHSDHVYLFDWVQQHRRYRSFSCIFLIDCRHHYQRLVQQRFDFRQLRCKLKLWPFLFKKFRHDLC